MGAEADADWAVTNGIRSPLTIKRPGDESPAMPMTGGEE
jgi:hypothetical protein